MTIAEAGGSGGAAVGGSGSAALGGHDAGAVIEKVEGYLCLAAVTGSESDLASACEAYQTGVNIPPIKAALVEWGRLQLLKASLCPPRRPSRGEELISDIWVDRLRGLVEMATD